MKMYRPHRLCPRNSKPKEPSLYHSLCVSILCMFLSTVMLVGTTMAWFSDSLQTGVYTITSADFSTTVYYCTELSNAENTPNNWQRLNPSNTTLFGGGSLSSADGQVAYLKLVSNSTIPLKYKFTLTASEANGNIDNLSLAGCQRVKVNEAEVDLSEPSLKTIDLSAIIPDSDSKTVVFNVPAATKGNTPAIVYAVLKLTYTSSSEATTSNIYNFSLKLEIMQDKDDANITESNSSTTNTEFTMEIGNAPSTPVLTAPNAAIVDKNDSNGNNDDVVNGNGSNNNNGTIESGGNGDANNGGNNDNDGNNDVDDSKKPADGKDSQSIDSPAENLS